MRIVGTASSSASAVHVSVITPTTGRTGLLEKKIESLRAQTLDPETFEWIVCVDGPLERVRAESLERMVLRDDRLAFPRVVLQRDVRGGAGAARNACLEVARGRITCLSDDDCVLPPDLLMRHADAQARMPGAWLGGIEFRSGGRVETWQPRSPGPEHLNGANASVPTTTLRDVGGFREHDTYGGEDIELGLRLVDHGLDVHALAGDPVVHMGPNPRWGSDPRKGYEAGRNAVAIAADRPAAAWRLGVARPLLIVKRLVIDGPVGALLRRFLPESSAGRLAYERAYLDGARAAHAQAALAASTGYEPSANPDASDRAAHGSDRDAME